MSSTTTSTKINDYTAYLTPLSLARKPSPIRALVPLLAIPNMISLAGGLPNPATFPIRKITIELTNNKSIELTTQETARFLQYGNSSGDPNLINYLHQLQAEIHYHSFGPDHEFAIQLGNGSQDLITKAIDMLVPPFGSILVESPCYVGILAFLNPFVRTKQLRCVPVPTDHYGIIPFELDQILSNWHDGPEKNNPIPKVLYFVPTGGNPSGSSAPIDRRNQIYQLAQKFDLIILEDDPYYYLQFNASQSGFDSAHSNPVDTLKSEVDIHQQKCIVDKYKSALVPSYLSMDIDGRVLRFESLSKLVSGGIRLGFCTGPKPLIHQLNLNIQSTCLQPTGPSQALILALFKSHWIGTTGFLYHTGTVSEFYRNRRDVFMQCLTQAKLKERFNVSYEIPTAGLFVWIKIPCIEDTTELIEKFARNALVLLLPGFAFIPIGQDDTKCQYVRATFSIASDEEMRLAATRFGECIELALKNSQVKTVYS